MKKPKLLIVGAFAFLNNDPKKREIYGGVLKSTQILMESHIQEKYKIIPIDSSQISIPPPGLLIRFFYSLKRILIIITKLIKDKPHAALIFSADGLSAIEKGFMVVLCRVFGCKTMIFPRAGNLIHQLHKSSFMFVLIRFLYSHASFFLCQGNKWKEFALKEFGFKESRVIVINNWTATAELIDIGNKRSYENEDTAKVLFLGWLEEFKGIFELLDASKALLSMGIDFHLSLAGRGKAEKLAKKFVKDNGMSDKVTFLGWVEKDSLGELLKKNNIFVLPSYSEGFPNAMIEAMASGLTVVVSSVGMVPDYLKNEQEALLVKPKDRESLEKALKKVITNTELRNKLALAGQNLAYREFSSSNAISQLEKVIDKCISKHRSRK